MGGLSSFRMDDVGQKKSPDYFNDPVRPHGTGAPNSPELFDHISSCHLNCSGNGECREGSCYCMIRYEGEECNHINFSYHVAFASIFYLLALTSLIQLAMCIHAEYLRLKKTPSVIRACRITTQKFLYFLVFLASILRGTYFAAPTVGGEVSTSLLSAYYPVVLTSASLLVCFWAEIFHLREVRWDRPRFLSKSFLGFLAFNVLSYSLLLAELLLVWLPPESEGFAVISLTREEEEKIVGWANTRREFYGHVFNGCYAVLMFVVVIFFLVYGVEVFFKVRGGFTVPRVPQVIGVNVEGVEEQQRRLIRRQQRRKRKRERHENMIVELEDLATKGTKSLVREDAFEKGDECRDGDVVISEHEQTVQFEQIHDKRTTTPKCSRNSSHEEEDPSREEAIGQALLHVSSQVSWTINGSSVIGLPPSKDAKNIQTAKPVEDIDPTINTSQLHQSRLGLLSQALMMIITVGFLFSETLEQFWKTRVNLSSRNTHNIVFHTIEIGVALWFPCVLWNCIRPDQLWCLNPMRILDEKLKSRFNKSPVDSKERESCSATPETTTDEDDEKGPECWICYDMERTDVGSMIRPCDCRGDVGAVHHDCLRRWLIESADNREALKCRVCSATYMVEKGSQFSLTNGFTARQWLQTASWITIVCLTVGGAWAVIQLHSQPWIRSLAVGVALFVMYICLRSLGLNALTAYQRAKVSALKIVNLRIRGQNRTKERVTARIYEDVGLPDVVGAVLVEPTSCPQGAEMTG